MILHGIGEEDKQELSNKGLLIALLSSKSDWKVSTNFYSLDFRARLHQRKTMEKRQRNRRCPNGAGMLYTSRLDSDSLKKNWKSFIKRFRGGPIWTHSNGAPASEKREDYLFMYFQGGYLSWVESGEVGLKNFVIAWSPCLPAVMALLATFR